jgi:exopolysaccharide biosynthesis polyprenyl glycosylphosphotransferase
MSGEFRDAENGVSGAVGQVGQVGTEMTSSSHEHAVHTAPSRVSAFPRQVGRAEADQAHAHVPRRVHDVLSLGATDGAAAVPLPGPAALHHAVALDTALASWLRVWGVHAEVTLVLAAGVSTAMVVPPATVTPLLALGVWMLATYHSGRAIATPLSRQLKSVWSAVMLPLAGLAMGVGFLGFSTDVVPPTAVAVAVAAMTATVCRVLRRRLQAPVRVVVVGDRAQVATAAARWGRSHNVRVVGGLVAEHDLDGTAVPLEILGVPTVEGTDAARMMAEVWEADLMLVHPGGEISPKVFRRLTWELEGTRCAVGVSSFLESVAPHRVAPGALGRTGIVGVRSPRPSRVVRFAKSAIDRVGGALLLVLFSPLLLAMVVAVRVDSRGKALFTQTRVGHQGRMFKVYKMRTMVDDAEATKAALAEDNEFDQVLFKMKRDPRITRVGSFLRKSSLDELPQLINVVRGEMSLVGPRPFLPQEVAAMDADTLRRHVVQPGMTGLWQVSGRSDLAWDEAAELDTYYADNWNLSGDFAIGLRTVKAVVAGKGAY